MIFYICSISNIISGRIERCKEKNEKVWNYASTIHGILSDKENDFHRALSEAMEELSLLNINDYEVDNTLGIKEYYTYTDYSDSYGYQGASNAKLITAERVKAKINFADIMAKTDMFGLDQQFKQYLKEEKKNIYEMSDKEIAEYRNKFYTDTLTTSFNHKMESNLEGISEFLDYVPVIGGLKGLMEGCTGYTMTGEKLTNSERISMGVLGTLSLAVDVATLGALSATTQGAKALAKEVGKVAFADIVIAGYGTKYTSEVMRNLGMSPEQVMMTHMVTSLAVGGYSSYKNYKKNLSDIMKNAGLDNIDQAKDLMKYTGLSSKELAKQLENSSIEDILGITKRSPVYNNYQDIKNAYKGKWTKFSKENKPKGSPNIKNWLEDGGTIAIEELGNEKYIWHYSKDGITVPYVPKEINGVTQNVVQFPKEFMYKDKNISNFSIDGGFTGNRNIDKQKALDHIKKFGYDRIPTGYVLHHDIDNGVFKLIREDIHETFKHYGGYYYNK